MTKTRAINYAMLETGLGRRVVENMIDELVRQGRIIVREHPADKRTMLISNSDVQTLIRALKGEQ